MPLASLLEETEISLAFNDFIKEYGRSYTDTEQAKRRAVFAKNYRLIQALNKDDPTVVFGVNEFADLTDEEFEEQFLDPLGANEKCTVAQRSVWSNPRESVELTQDLEIDWVTRGKVSAVKNQGQCGSCWTFAAATILETIFAIRENRLPQLAEQQIVDCCRKNVSPECPISAGCKGGIVGEAFQYAINKGMMESHNYQYTGRDGVCKYDANKIFYKPHGYVDIKPGDVKEMERMILTRTIAVGLSASHPAFRYYKSGVVDKDCPEEPLNHGVAVVGAGTEAGTGKKYWLVRNSWGSSWGDKGYIRLSRSLDKYPTGVCGVASCPEYVNYKE